MAWIESHQALARHPKTIRFANRLGESVPSAIGRLHLLWWWALEYAEDGDLGEYQDGEIAFAMMWDGDPTILIDALKASGFLDPDRQIHDWWDYAGRLVDQRRANAHRMRETRAAHVQEMCDTRTGATVPNSTVPNTTEPAEHDTTDVLTIACSDKTAAAIPKPVPKPKPKQPKDPPVYSEHVLFVCQCFERVPGRLTAFHRQLIDQTVAQTGPTAFHDAVRWKAGNDGKYNLNAIITTAKKIAKEGSSRVQPGEKSNNQGPPALILARRMFCPLCSMEIRNGRMFDGQHQACEASDRFLEWESTAFPVLEERWAVTAAELEAIKVKGDAFQWLATLKSS